MAIEFSCPSCARRWSVPLEYAGRQVRCRSCGHAMRVPAADVTVASAPVGEPVPVPQPPSTPVYTCSTCGGAFGVDQVYDQNGSVICVGCFERQSASAAAPPATEVSATEPSAPRRVARSSGVPGYVQWTIGGAVAAAVLGIVAFAVHRQMSRPTVVVLAPAAPTRSSGPGNATGPRRPPPLAASEIAAPPVATQPATLDPVEWEKQNGPKLQALRQGAQELTAAGDFKGADAKYREYFELARPAMTPGSGLRIDLADARASWDAVREHIAAGGPSATASSDDGAPAVAMSGDHAESVAMPKPQEPWEPAHRAEVQRLLALAGRQLAANNKVAAALAYQQLFNLAGAHLAELHDPALRRQLADAAVARTRLIAEVKTSPESIALTADALLGSGLEALQRRRWQAGLESMADVVLLFDRNVKVADRARSKEYVMALHGMAVAYLETKQVSKAGELFDEARPLGKAVENNPTRELVMNRAVTDVIQRTKAARAAKDIKAFLEKHPGGAPDEAMLNLLGTAIFVGGQHVANANFLNACADFYVKQNAALEQTRPGEKRWGVQWLPATEAEQKIQELRKETEEWQRLSKQSGAAYAEWQRQIELYQPHGFKRVRYTTEANVLAAERRYHELAAAADAQRGKIPVPPWLDELEPVMPAPAVQVASAGGATDNGMSPPAEADAGTPPANVEDSTTVGSTAAPPAGPAAAEPSAPPRRAVPVTVQRHALAFPVGPARLVTSADVVGGAVEVKVTGPDGIAIPAHVSARENGLALLEVSSTQLPAGPLRFLNLAPSFAGGPVRCAAIPEENIFAPQVALLAGDAPAPPESGEWFTNLGESPRLSGSPLLDAQGQVVGVVLAGRDDPKAHLPAASLASLSAFLSAHAARPAAPCPNPDPLNVFEVTVGE